VDRDAYSPRPMAAAADALARSAQNRPGDPVPSRDAVSNFRGVAAIVAQSQLSNNHRWPGPCCSTSSVAHSGRSARHTLPEGKRKRPERWSTISLEDSRCCTIGSRRPRRTSCCPMNECPTIATPLPGTRRVCIRLRITGDGSRATIAASDASNRHRS
jgi:hypothetical protein